MAEKAKLQNKALKVDKKVVKDDGPKYLWLDKKYSWDDLKKESGFSDDDLWYFINKGRITEV